MRQNPQYQGRSDISLDHERRGTVWDLSIEDREKAAAGLQVLGYDDDARTLRAFNERLTRRAAMTVVPDDPRRRLKNTGDRPILVALEGHEAPATADDLRRAHMLRLARVSEQGAASSWATPAEKTAFASAAERCRRAALD